MGKIRVLVNNIIFSGLVIAFVGFLYKLDQRWLVPLPIEFEYFAWPLFILGSLLILSAAWILMRKSGSTGAPTDPTPKIVTRGIYQWIRNPIYLGDIFLLFGISFFTRSITLLLLATISIPCADLFVRYYEEPKTEQRFGDEYRKYKQSVPRWIPRIPRRLPTGRFSR